MGDAFRMLTNSLKTFASKAALRSLKIVKAAMNLLIKSASSIRDIPADRLSIWKQMINQANDETRS